MEMVALSSNLIKVFRIILLVVISLNTSGVLIINFLLSTQKAKTYDLSLNYGLISICTFVFIISSKVANNVIYDKKAKVIIVNTLLKKTIINTDDILKIERVLPGKCKIVFKKNNIVKNILFIPKISRFSPLSNYVEKIKALIKEG